MRPVSNPPNPWTSEHVEWLEEPPAVELVVYEEEARSILTENSSPDVPFRYGVNPYRGCQHACAYCYARPGHQHLGFGAGTDFDSRIVVKRNAPELLRREILHPRMLGQWVAFSGVTDCYQPLEASYGLTRACLEVCEAAGAPVGIITKGALVRRDAELLRRIEEGAGARVFVSIPSVRAETSRLIEPLVGTPAARFETIRRLTEAGVPTGVAIAPVIPGLSEPEIPEILERAREAGASSAFMILLRLGQEVRPVFEERVREALPLRAGRILSALDELRAEQGGARSGFGTRMQGAGPRWQTIEQLFSLRCRQLGYEVGEERDPRQPASALEPRRRPPGGGAGTSSSGQSSLFPS